MNKPEWVSSGYNWTYRINAVVWAYVGRKMAAKGEPVVYRYHINGVQFKREFSDVDECKVYALNALKKYIKNAMDVLKHE